MFCPRCGRRVNENANFCGGCGLPIAEMEKYSRQQEQMQTPYIQPAQQIPSVDIDDLNNTISRLEDDLSGVHPVDDYTTDVPDNTNVMPKENNVTADGEDENKGDVNTRQVQNSVSDNAGSTIPTYSYYGQSDYSRQAPKAPNYRQMEKDNYQVPQGNAKPLEKDIRPLSTVDFIWMMLISNIPIVGMMYIIYLAASNRTNVNKRSWATALIIIKVFVRLLVFAFIFGLVLTL